MKDYFLNKEESISRLKNMKKAICFVIAIFAFIVGIFVYYARSSFIPISLLELSRNESQYQYLKIKVVGKLEVAEGDSQYYIYLKDWDKNCSVEGLCYQLQISEEVKAENIVLIKELAEKNKTLGATNNIRGEYLAEVEIMGRLVETKTFLGDKSFDLKVEKLHKFRQSDYLN